MAVIELPISIDHLEAVIKENFKLVERPEIIDVEYDEFAEQLFLKVVVDDYEFIDGFFTNLEQAIDTDLLEEML